MNDGDNRELLKEERENGAEGAAATEEPAGSRDTGDGGAPPGLLQMDRGSSFVEGDCWGEGVSELRQGTHRPAGVGWSLESSLKTGRFVAQCHSASVRGAWLQNLNQPSREFHTGKEPGKMSHPTPPSGVGVPVCHRWNPACSPASGIKVPNGHHPSAGGTNTLPKPSAASMDRQRTPELSTLDSEYHRNWCLQILGCSPSKRQKWEKSCAGKRIFHPTKTGGEKEMSFTAVGPFHNVARLSPNPGLADDS